MERKHYLVMQHGGGDNTPQNITNTWFVEIFASNFFFFSAFGDISKGMAPDNTWHLVLDCVI